MSAKNAMPSCIDTYNALSVADQTVLQALSVLYLPASAVLAASCLGAAGCRESSLRAFSPQNVAVRLARLARAGLTRETIHETKTGKIRLWNCRPETGEVAARHAVRDGRFLPLSKAALAETRGRGWRGEGDDDSLRRRLRLDFHAGGWHAFLSDFALLREEEPGRAGSFVGALVSLQPDDSWRRAEDVRPLAGMLIPCLKDMLAGLAPAAPLDAMARDIAAGLGPGPDTEPLLLALGDASVLQGRPAAAVNLAKSAFWDDSRLILHAAAALAGGEEKAAGFAESALAARRGRLGGREHLLPGLGGLWHALAVTVSDDSPAIEAMRRRLTAPGARDHEFAGALACLGYALLHQDGQVHAAKALPDSPPDAHPLTRLAHALALLRVDPSRLAPLAPGLGDMARLARTGGYRWLAAQFAAVLAAAGQAPGPEDAETPAGTKRMPLAGRFTSRDEWRRGLKALDDLVLEPDEAREAPRKRLAWLVEFPERPENPFCPVALHPIEQSLTKGGQWSKGRHIALQRVFQRRSDLDFATDQDRMAFLTLALDFDAGGSGYSFDVQAALPVLAGHPLLFRGDAGGARLEIAAGRFELAAASRDGGCEIALEPPLAEFAPAGRDTAAVLSGADIPETVARLETPTRLRVYRLGEREKRLARVIGGGLVIPAAGREEAIRTLSRLAGRVRIQSDIPELAGEGELVEADPYPRFHVMPHNPGLKIEAWAHPLGDSGSAYRPGRGGKILSAEVEGHNRRAVRNMKLEKELTREAVAACPSLRGRESGELSWLLDDPEEALSFLAETEKLSGKATLAWPKGGRCRVRTIRGASALGLRINTSPEWFEIAGGLRVDENLVIDMGQLLAAAHSASGRFIPLGEGEYLALTEELKRQLADLGAFGERHGDAFRLPALAASILEGLEESGVDLRADAEWRLRLERRRSLGDFSPEPPANFRAELRPYQLDGFRWLARLAEWGAGACLADDMGLGKTVQALAILVRRSALGPSLVVAPTSVCHNWLAETARFAPSLRAAPFRAGDRAGQAAALGPGDVLVASYALLRQEEKIFAGVEWGTAVLDEAQAIKNVAAKRSRAAMNLRAGFRLITTGTPIENHLGELWNLFRFINPRLLGSWRAFQERFAVPIERLGDREARERLRRILRPFILRRTKAQVLASLPPKTEITLAVELDGKERAFYESLRRNALERLGDASAPPEGRRFRILAEIMRLRRACCSPELVSPGLHLPSAKQAEFQRILSDLVDNGHKALVFSQFVDHLSIIRRYLEKNGFSHQYLDGSTPARRRKEAVDDFQSGKGDVFLISLKAGGLGLNLTAADYVIHMDPWWNPAVEDQASDRAHRIGQEKPVTVYRLVAAGTIEEKIVELHRDKRDLADSLLSGADQAAGMDIEDMLRLLREE